MNVLRRTGNFYRRIIMKNIGIFLFIGLLAVIFNDHGWFPNEKIYAVSQLVYQIILPVRIAFESGQALGGTGGGLLAVLAVSGVLTDTPQIGILGAMVSGPVSGVLWKKLQYLIERRASGRFHMLLKNLCIGIFGGILAALGIYVITPMLEFFQQIVYYGMHFLVIHKLLWVLSIIIEPAKVFFLNNLVNHAILIPLGMSEVQELGSSVLFLLETNPGPGMGFLLALWYAGKGREERDSAASALAAQAAGGIHEVYFPFVLSDLRFLAALILGGIAGNLCFSFLHAGLQGAVSPGSIFLVLFMAGRDGMLPVLCGISVSAALSFLCSLLILRMGKPKCRPLFQAEEEAAQESGTREQAIKKTEEKKAIRKIAFVCDGGMGSSAMGAALFRRAAAKEGLEGISAEPFAADLVPEDADLIVCQKDFSRTLPETLSGVEIYTVESLVKTDEYQRLTEILRRRMEEKK